MKSKTKYISQLIRQYISSVDPNAEIILYGSQARGDARDDSDWDILVLTDYEADVLTERKFRDKIYDLELEIGESFSVFAYSRKNWQKKQSVTPFYKNVLREGIQL